MTHHHTRRFTPDELREIVPTWRSRVRFRWHRAVWRWYAFVCWLIGHNAPQGECIRCWMLVDEDQITPPGGR